MAYHRPTELKDALDILADSGMQVLAGGTDIFPAHNGPELSGDVLDISGIAGLNQINQTADGWRIGATTTWADVANADLPAAFYGLQQAAGMIGSKQIQNSATVAGNLCNASPAADGVPPLLVLDAEIEIAAFETTRQLPLGEFLQGVRKTALEAHEIVTAIHLPNHAIKGTSAFQKLGARKYMVISISMVAARLTVNEGRISQAAISIGACSPVAQRLPALEAALIGQKPNDPDGWLGAIEQQVNSLLTPIDDIRADAGYRLSSAMELVQRTILEALQ